MMTLCIAELADGRSALCYIDPVTMKASVVCILRPEDLISYHRDKDSINRKVGRQPIPVAEVGLIVGAQPLDILRPRPKPRITVDDLLDMAQDATTEPGKTRQEKLLDDIERLLRGEEPTE